VAEKMVLRILGKLQINRENYTVSIFTICNSVIDTITNKAIPLKAWTGPEDSRSLRLIDITTVGTRKW
jgi:hypothetical protein